MCIFPIYPILPDLGTEQGVSFMGGTDRRGGRVERRSLRPALENLEAREMLATLIAAPAPQVTSVVRRGMGHQPTQIVLTFSQAMDRTSVQNTGDYLLAGRNRAGRFDPSTNSISVRSAVYDASAQTVTLTTRGRLNLHRDFLLVVNANFAGLASAQGIVLDGNSQGTAGGNFVTVLRGFGPKG